MESVENYAHSRVVFMNVDNIHTMRDSLKTVFDLLRTGKGDNRWLSSLDSTRWLEHLRLVLSGGARVRAAYIALAIVCFFLSFFSFSLLLFRFVALLLSSSLASFLS